MLSTPCWRVLCSHWCAQELWAHGIPPAQMPALAHVLWVSAAVRAKRPSGVALYVTLLARTEV